VANAIYESTSLKKSISLLSSKHQQPLPSEESPAAPFNEKEGESELREAPSERQHEVEQLKKVLKTDKTF